MYESLQATFERIRDVFELDLEPSKATLAKLQRQAIPLGGKESLVANMVAQQRLQMNETWDQVDAMLDHITSIEFRQSVADSHDRGWIYNWFCLDHVGYTGLNPRRRDMGHHNIFDHYKSYLAENELSMDLVQWHYHPLPISKDANRSGTTFLNSGHIYEILARKVIDRTWFPAAFRPGFHTERPDSNFFLEQWIPFDFGNQSTSTYQSQPDLSGSRFGDWRRAPKSWRPYRPSHDDYQVPGQCRRHIARCLNMEARLRELTQEDVRLAFVEAEQHGSSLLAFTNHDFRDMAPEIKKVWALIESAQREFHGVGTKHVNAIEGFRRVLGLSPEHPPHFDLRLVRAKTSATLTVKSSGAIFGPQPFLAIKTLGGDYVWENFDFDDASQWSYTFDYANVSVDQIESLGVAANTASGVTEVVVLDTKTGHQNRRTYNEW